MSNPCHMSFRRGLALICISGLAASTAIAPAASKGACNEKAIRNLFREFIHAYNSGDLATLDTLFPSQENFGLYRAFPERDGPSAQDRSTLMSYFEERHAKGDELEIESVSVSSERSPDGSCGIGYVLKRKSDDVLPWGDGTFSGKGGIKPKKKHIWAINMSWGP
jgi:hypothetical protein